MQHYFPLLIILNLLAASVGVAALPTEAASSISFYRNRSSQFPSGQAQRQDLEAQILRQESDESYTLSWNNKQFQIPESNLIQEFETLHFAETKQTIALLIAPIVSANTTRSLSPKSPVEIIDINGQWVQIKSDNGEKGWTLRKFLQARNDDLGILQPLIETSLRNNSNTDAKIILNIPVGKRLIPLEFKNGFVRISFQGQNGWVDLWHLIGRMDFAKFAFHKKHKWLEISHRLNDQIITKNGLNLKLSSIEGWHGLADRVLVKNISLDSPPLRAYLKIISKSNNQWVLSKIEKHGEVWWKKNSEPASLINNKQQQSEILTTDLLKKELFSIAFKSKDSLAGLVSSEGVWRSEDGKTWAPIPRFEKDNLPVAIWPGGDWFVGIYRSTDQGKSFQPFIRWEALTASIEAALGRPPKHIKLTQLNPISNNIIEITVDTGGHFLRLKSNTTYNNWKIIR